MIHVPLIEVRSLMSEHWGVGRDGDVHGWRLMRRHYSARRYRGRPRQRQFAGPGEKVVLITPDNRALFVWRKFQSMDLIHGAGINCAVFRNEGPVLSSTLIQEADAIADAKWPGERHYTYVNPRRVRSSNPGYCFVCAGWRRCGTSRKGLVVLERAAVEPAPAETNR